MTRPDDPWTDPGTGQPLAVPRREFAESTGYRYEALWQDSARAAGWVPLADVLDALRRDGAFLAWFQTTNPDTYLDLSVVEQIHDYLAERFAPTVPEGANETEDGHG